MKKSLVLASSSKARQSLIKRLKVPYTIDIPDIDETPLPHEDPKVLVARLALEKAKVVASRHPNSFIIGCDQVGALEDVILGKPLTYENAVKQLKFKSGKCVRFYTAMCLYDSDDNTYQAAIETYDVYIRPLTDELIQDYLKKENPLECAGSLDIEGYGIRLIDKLDGDDYTALIGLPLIRLSRMLEKVGLL